VTTPGYGIPPYEHNPTQVRYIRPCEHHTFVCANCGQPPGEDDKARIKREAAEREEQQQLAARRRERNALAQQVSDRRYRETMETWYRDDAKNMPGWMPGTQRPKTGKRRGRGK